MSILFPGKIDTLGDAHADGVNEIIHASDVNDLADGVNALERAHAGLASYVIRKNSDGNFEGLSPAGLAYVSPNADAGAVMQSCLDNMDSTNTPRGTIVFAPDTVFTWTSTPHIPKTYASGGSDDNEWLRILGSGGSVIQFTSTARLFLGCDAPSDYDGFCGVEIGHLTFDDNSLAATSNSNIVCGTREQGVSSSFQRTDFKRWYLHDLDGKNVLTPTAASGVLRAWVWFSLTHAAVSEGTQTVLDDFRIEDCRFEGGTTGLALTATNSGAGGTAGLNIFGDNIVVKNFHFDSLQAADYAPSTSCMQIGSGMFGDRMTLENVYLAGSADDGLEVNNFRTITVKNTTIERCLGNGFEPVMFNYVNGVDNSEAHTQTILFEDCLYIHGGSGSGSGSTPERAYGIFFAGTAGIDLGTVTLRRCKNRCDAPLTSNSAIAPCFFVGALASNIEQIVLEDCNFETYYNMATGQNNLTPIWCYQLGKKFVVRNLNLTLRGTQSSGTYFCNMLYLNDHTNTTRLDIDGVFIKDLRTSVTAFASYAIYLGPDNTNGVNVMGGDIKNVVIYASGDTGIKGVRVADSAHLTLKKTRLDGIDHSLLSSDGGIVAFNTSGQNESTLFIRNPKPRVTPMAEVSFTPGATTVAAQYTGHYEGLMTVTGGTVTVVEVSTDGSTFRQVAAATNCSFYIDHGMYVRMTYSVTPTCKVIPRR